MPSRRTDRELLLRQVSSSQHGIVDRAQLHQLGFSDGLVQQRRRDGLLVDVFRGVYRVPPHPLTREAREMAALRACGPDAAVGLRSAAAHDGWLIWDGPVEVIVPTHRRKQPGLHPRTFPLGRWDVTVIDGIRRTTRHRTLADLATVLGVGEIERVVHEAEFRRHLREGSVRRAIARSPRRRRTRILEQALDRRRRLVGNVDSGVERRFARFLGERGYPPTEHGAPFVLGGRTVYLDVLFRDLWFGVEVDGDPHKTEDRFHSDRARDLRFDAEYGLPVARVTEQQIDGAPDELDAVLWAALRRRDPGLRRCARSIRDPIARKHL